MCGICGQLNFASDDPVDRRVIEVMKRTIVHRGPDDEGTFLDREVGLGFRRLSIIDLGGGHQPMSDQDETVWVVFNGEIYNFQELRSELESHGCVFRTKSDTEVIVHGYKVWGADVLRRLNGMFGLAIWDVQRRRLVLARDRAGIKLIYYKLDRGRLFFGSEIRPIVAATGGGAELDPSALQLFLKYRYTPSPFTLFQGVRKIPPGSCMIVEKGQVKVSRYWDFHPATFAPPPSVAEAEEKLLALYQQAVRRQLISDVPLGLLLSGGLDSALLLALISGQGDVRKTFTFGYGAENDPDDELEDAARTASALGAPNFATRIDHNAFESMLPKITRILEEPVATASVIPMYFVCERARRDVTVALAGQGPDELFCGYKRHLGLRLGEMWRRVPRPLRKVGKGLLNSFRRSEALRRGLFALETENRLERFQNVFALLPGDRINGLFHPGLLPPDVDSRILECWKDVSGKLDGLDELSAMNFIEVNLALPDELLMYSDKISMHHGLELRVPYLDHDIIEYAVCLPQHFKVRGLQRKWLHRRVCRHSLPPEVLRRRKRGFSSTVVDQWFRSSMGGRAADLLTDTQSLMFKYLQRDQVLALLAEHKSGAGNHYKILFSFVLLEEWLRNFSVSTPVAETISDAVSSTAPVGQ
jgi:asparagine synthase (glutamine-hydrolysing)